MHKHMQVTQHAWEVLLGDLSGPCAGATEPVVKGGGGWGGRTGSSPKQCLRSHRWPVVTQGVCAGAHWDSPPGEGGHRTRDGVLEKARARDLATVARCSWSGGRRGRGRDINNHRRGCQCRAWLGDRRQPQRRRTARCCGPRGDTDTGGTSMYRHTGVSEGKRDANNTGRAVRQKQRPPFFSLREGVTISQRRPSSTVVGLNRHAQRHRRLGGR